MVVCVWGGGAGLTLLLIARAQGSCAWAEGLGVCVCVSECGHFVSIRPPSGLGICTNVGLRI